MSSEVDRPGLRRRTAHQPLEPISVASTLVEAREAAGLSQQEVAASLRLSSTFIRYLDEGDYQKLPHPVFVKGYLRSYARLVGLSEAELLARYREEQPENGKKSSRRRIRRDKTAARESGPSIQITVVFSLTLLVVGLWLLSWLF